nr:xaa-Pro aminopeptidase 3-like [Rhipicephalus microplus]
MWYSVSSRLPCRAAAAGYRLCQTQAAKPECGSRQPRLYGQPTAATHPHLLREDELTPGLTRQEFAYRRQKLIDDILQLCAFSGSPGTRTTKNHAVVVLSATKAYMSDKIPYPFRQNSDFLYLTGFQEPDSALVIHASTDQRESKSVMFVPQRDAHAELWDGPCAGPLGAVDLLGVDAAYEIGELQNYVDKLLKAKYSTTLWYDRASSRPEASGILGRLADSYKNNVAVESPRLLIQKMRLIKSEAEQQLMKQTCQVACEAMTEVMRASHAGVTEAQLHSKMEFECRIRGAQRLAYPPVVAGGARANIIHYVANDQRVLDGELVLMDGGCELHGYTSDLTRTWPVNGRFEPGQRELYELLWDVQQLLLRKLEGPMSLDALFHIMCAQLGHRLREAGILSPHTPDSELVQEAHKLCPHHVGHYLGMDVHDTPLIPRSLRLAPGSVLTVEPGIYIPESNTKVAKKFRGMGMRIEDDVLMTGSGPQVLTESCAREPDLLEKLASGFPSSEAKR